MPEHRKSRVALVGPAAQALAPVVARAGFELDPWEGGGAAAVIDLSLPAEDRAEIVQLAREVYTPLIGLLPDEAAVDPVAESLDGVIRVQHVATDLPMLLRTLVQAAQDRAEMQGRTDDLSALVELTGALAAGGDPERLLSQVVQRIAGRLTVARCSMVLLDDDGNGTVVAASDDPEARGKHLALSKYPEIREVVRTARPLAIDDAQEHPLLDPVRPQIEGRISAMAVIPMASQGAVLGVLFIRANARRAFTSRELGFVTALASATAVALRNAGLIQKERRQRVAAERELSQLRRYEEFFSHVNDGMAVLDLAGRVLAINPAGCAILGVQQDEARGFLFAELVAQESELEAGLLWREIIRGSRVLAADLRVRTRDGRLLTLSVSAGPLRSQNGRAILSFRDVSEGRELQLELRKTKEFLERLIDATPDGIVAADLSGKVLLFNQGAEKIAGFAAAEVIGKDVRELYPQGQAEQIMRRLRSARAEGHELPPFPGEIVAKSGEAVPVEISLALVAEGGEETATVGVFRDLREELQREAELRKTREKLEQAQKAALVSELAGAAAHELNQPLTSVLGFSELLFRRAREHDKGREELAAILREAERMATIVKKIGKITRYETTAYVGNTRIVDLDRSSDPPPAAIVIRDKP